MRTKLNDRTRTANYVVVILRAMFTWAIDQRHLAKGHENPTDGIKLFPKRDKNRANRLARRGY